MILIVITISFKMTFDTVPFFYNSYLQYHSSNALITSKADWKIQY
jgi:hypothetical protein